MHIPDVLHDSLKNAQKQERGRLVPARVLESTKLGRPRSKLFMKAKIMIVDDDQPLRALVKEILAIEGYEVSEAGDAAGLRRALAGPPPDALVLDLSLPDGDGLAMLPEVKQKWPGSKVVILTGHGTVDAAHEAYGQMRDVYFQGKPFDAGLLKALLELALREKRQA